MCEKKFEPMEKKNCQNWKEFIDYIRRNFVSESEEWLFRGLSGCHSLETTLKRAFDKWHIFPDDYVSTERYLIRDFQRRYILAKAEQTPPRQEDKLAWLALMQHHGAPTRLMDWTYSPYIAAFFAAEKCLRSMKSKREAPQASDEKDKPEPACRKKLAMAVWAVRRRWFDVAATSIVSEEQINKLKCNDINTFNELFIEARPRRAFVYPVVPYSLNERLTIQQGVFLCPGDFTLTFQENLLKMPDSQKVENSRKIVLSIDNPNSKELQIILDDLLRMNIYRASLFPGMDGYAQSFETRLPLLSKLSKSY